MRSCAHWAGRVGKTHTRTASSSLLFAVALRAGSRYNRFRDYLDARATEKANSEQGILDRIRDRAIEILATDDPRAFDTRFHRCASTSSLRRSRIQPRDVSFIIEMH